MKLTPFPREVGQLAAIRSSLSTASIGGVREAVEALTALTDQKTGMVAQTVFDSGLFEAALDRMDELSDREMHLNQRIGQLRQELSGLEIMMNRLPPLQIEGHLDALQGQISSCGKPSTQQLQKQLSELEERWNHLYFLHTFPDTEELNPDSFQSNLWHRLRSAIQRNPKAAELLASLEQQCKAAERVFNGQGLAAYQELPVELRLDIEQRLFEKYPGYSLEQAEREGILAAAIMASLGDRMMGTEV